MATKIPVGDGKYEVRHNDGTGLCAYRNDQYWRDLTGDGLILAMAQDIEELREKLAAKPPEEKVEMLVNIGGTPRLFNPFANLPAHASQADRAGFESFVSSCFVGYSPHTLSRDPASGDYTNACKLMVVPPGVYDTASVQMLWMTYCAAKGILP